MSQLKRGLRLFFILIVFIASCFVILNEFIYALEDDYYEETEVGYYEEGDCNVDGITLHGYLSTYVTDSGSESTETDNFFLLEASSEDIAWYIDSSDKDEAIKAIILEIDSWGGGPVASEEVADALKRAQKPTVAFIRSVGTSGAYWAASGADIIFASANSDVGGIGVTMSYIDYAKNNQKEGFTYNQLSSAKFKDYGDPEKPLTYDEKQLLMRDINILHENFVKAVAENRELDLAEVQKLADGSSVLGEKALEQGLIDRIGGYYDVVDYLEELIGEEADTCWY